VKFKLSENFISKYKRKKAPFGFNGLGELVYMRTYSRIKEDGKNERWWETVQRVVEGTYSMQMNHIDSHQLGWNPWKERTLVGNRSKGCRRNLFYAISLYENIFKN